MKPPARLLDRPKHAKATPVPATKPAPPERAYDATFWVCYVANCCLVMTFSIMFRYADFVAYLGGSEMHLGLIVGVGMVGALAMRVFQGVGIDRYGPRRVWLLSLIMCSASMLAHLWITRVDGIGVYLVRILFMTSIAGAFGASLTSFFLVYATVAMLVRIATRRLPDQIGVRPVILWGLSCAAVSMLAFLLVSGEWSLAIPAVFMGTAHAFLFPAVLAGCNAAFPNRYRGIATTLMLAMFDIGSLIGQPMVGGIIDGARYLGWPAYPTMFLTVATAVLAIAMVYRHRTRRLSNSLV